MVKVLFICTGNICRSSTAEGVFRSYVEAAGLSDHIEIDSVGTGGWHVGEPPDRRSQEAAARRGYDLTDLRARQLTQQDVLEFDYLIAMDSSHVDALQIMTPAAERAKLSLLLKFAPELGETDVPDPYYGGASGFDHVLDLIEAGAAKLLAHIQRRDF